MTTNIKKKLSERKPHVFRLSMVLIKDDTVCPGSSDPPETYSKIFASEK